MPVEIVVGARAGGLPTAEVAREYGITIADVRAALTDAARVLGDERAPATHRAERCTEAR